MSHWAIVASPGVIRARAAIVSTQTARSRAAPTRHSRRIMSILPPQAPRDARQKDHARHLELLPRRVYRNITSSRPGDRQTHTHTQARRVEMMSTCCLLIKYEWYKGYRNVEKYHRYKGQRLKKNNKVAAVIEVYTKRTDRGDCYVKYTCTYLYIYI